MPTGPRPQPPVGTCKLAIEGLLFGLHPVINVLWLKLTSAGTPNAADLLALDTIIGGAFTADIIPSLSSNYQRTKDVLTWITGAGTVVRAEQNWDAVGGQGAAVQDASATFVLDWAISAYYRGGHPRSYLGGVPVADLTNGSTIGSTRRSALAAGANTFLAAVNAATHGDITATVLGTVSFASGKAWRTPPVFRPYSHATVRSLLGTQRRRIGRP